MKANDTLDMFCKLMKLDGGVIGRTRESNMVRKSK